MKERTNAFNLLLNTAYLGVGAFVLFQLVRAGDYYLTAYKERPFHPDYAIYRPAGSMGLWFGIIGSTMMGLLLLYSLRKRTRIFGSLFRVKYWLDVHILFGIAGPLLVLLHTSFKLDGLVAVSFWSMAAVAGSGVFGRYLYLQIPHNIKGDELNAQELEEQKQAKTDEIRARFHLDDQKMNEMSKMLGSDAQQSAQVGILKMITGDLRRKLTWRSMHKALMRRFAINEQEARDLVQAAMQKSILELRIARIKKVHQLFHYWHVIHRPFALIMYIVMVIHIVVALLFGISWRKVA